MIRKDDLENFDRTIRLYLVPLLPKRFRIVTDTAHFTMPNGKSHNGFVCYIFDQDGKEIVNLPAIKSPTHQACSEAATEIAHRVMRLEMAKEIG